MHCKFCARTDEHIHARTVGGGLGRVFPENAPETIHWGLSSPGNSALCGADTGSRWATIRLINCQFCINIIDLHLRAKPAKRAGEKAGG